MPRGSYRLVCLDAGFTLIKPRRSIAATLAATLREAGITPTDAALQQAWDAADRWFWDDYHRLNNRSWASDDGIRATWSQYHGLMLQVLGVEDQEQRLVATMIAAYDQPANWELYDDVLPCLRALAARDIPLCIISDWSSHLEPLLDALGIRSYFRFVLASAAVGLAKPSAAFFAKALELAAVAPDEAVMVGDSHRADVLGARTAGMDAVLLDRSGKANNLNERSILSLTELPAIVAA